MSSPNKPPPSNDSPSDMDIDSTTESGSDTDNDQPPAKKPAINDPALSQPPPKQPTDQAGSSKDSTADQSPPPATRKVRGPYKKGAKFVDLPPDTRAIRSRLTGASSTANINDGTGHLPRGAALLKGLNYAKSMRDLRSSGQQQQPQLPAVSVNPPLGQKQRCGTTGDLSKITARVSSFRDKDDQAMQKIRGRTSLSIAKPPSPKCPPLKRTDILPDLFNLPKLGDERKTGLTNATRTQRSQATLHDLSRLPRNRRPVLSNAPCKPAASSSPPCSAPPATVANAPKPVVPPKPTLRPKPQPPHIRSVVDFGTSAPAPGELQDTVQPVKPLTEKEQKEKVTRLERTKTAFLKELDDQVNKYHRNKLQVQGPWGVSINVPQPPVVEVPPHAKAFTEEFNAKLTLTDEETEQVNALREYVLTSLQRSAMRGIDTALRNSNLTKTVDKIKIKDAESGKVFTENINHYKPAPHPLIPDMQELMSTVISEICREFSGRKFIPSVFGTKKAASPQASTSTQGQGLGGTSTAFSSQGQSGANLTPKIIVSKNIPKTAPYITNELIGRELSRPWGVVHGITLTNEDAVEILDGDYVDNVIDAFGLDLEQRSILDPTMLRTAFITTNIMQMLLQGDFTHPQLQPLIQYLRDTSNLQILLAPLHNVQNDHWTLAVVGLPGHQNPARRYLVNNFDPFQTEGDFASLRSYKKFAPTKKEKEDRDAIDTTMAALRTLRLFLQHVYNNDPVWALPSPTWPLEQGNLQVPEIPPQGYARECGPILQVGMEYFTNSPSFMDPVRYQTIQDGRWREIRDGLYLSFRELTVGRGVGFSGIAGVMNPVALPVAVSLPGGQNTARDASFMPILGQETDDVDAAAGGEDEGSENNEE